MDGDNDMKCQTICCARGPVVADGFCAACLRDKASWAEHCAWQKRHDAEAIAAARALGRRVGVECTWSADAVCYDVQPASLGYPSPYGWGPDTWNKV